MRYEPGELDVAQRVPERAPQENEEQAATIARLEQQIEALTAGLQKVSAQLELVKAAPKTVLNNR